MKFALEIKRVAARYTGEYKHTHFAKMTPNQRLRHLLHLFEFVQFLCNFCNTNIENSGEGHSQILTSWSAITPPGFNENSRDPNAQIRNRFSASERASFKKNFQNAGLKIMAGEVKWLNKKV